MARNMALSVASFTADLDRATRAARQMRAGQVFVNQWFAGGVETPFGGYRQIRLRARKGARGALELRADQERGDQVERLRHEQRI